MENPNTPYKQEPQTILQQEEIPQQEIQQQPQFIEQHQQQGHETTMEMGQQQYQYGMTDDLQKALYQQYVAMTQPGVVMNPQLLHAYTQQYRLPTNEVQVEEEPIYVNAKQYHRILVRREQRAKLERQNKLVKQRRPFLHQSRHNHAKNRKRGPNGRFMSKKEREKYEKEQGNQENQQTQGTQNSQGSQTPTQTGSGTTTPSTSVPSTPDPKPTEKKKRGRKKGTKQTLEAVEATVSQLQQQQQPIVQSETPKEESK